MGYITVLLQELLRLSILQQNSLAPVTLEMNSRSHQLILNRALHENHPINEIKVVVQIIVKLLHECQNSRRLPGVIGNEVKITHVLSTPFLYRGPPTVSKSKSISSHCFFMLHVYNLTS